MVYVTKWMESPVLQGKSALHFYAIKSVCTKNTKWNFTNNKFRKWSKSLWNGFMSQIMDEKFDTIVCD